MDENPEDGSKSISVDEFMEELSKLQRPQKLWLLSQAKAMAYGTIYSSDGEALLNEALTRILEESRHPKAGLEVTTYLFGVMKSIVSAERSKHPKNHELVKVDGDGPELSDHGNLPDGNELEVTYLKEDVLNEFGKSSAEARILEAYLEGWSQKDICELESLTKLEYEAAMKRVRRYLTQKHSGGEQ